MTGIGSKSAVALAVVALAGAFATPAWAPIFMNKTHPRTATSHVAAHMPPHAHCVRRDGHLICKNGNRK